MVIGSIGQAAIRVLLVVVILSLLTHLQAIRSQSSLWRQWSRRLMVVQFLAAAVASGALITLLVTGDNSYAYVSEYTGVGLPLIYRVAAFWGGNAGSLLLWALVLTLYGWVVAYSKHEDSERMLPIVSLVLTAITLFYTLVLNFNSAPFLRLPHAMPGSGLNPLLQNPGMTVHPVNVYLGYIGFSVPFAYAMAGLWLRKTDATWLKVTRRWTLISWLFLGIGIVYGAHWSYEELGWGGYWAWDPVENASLLPWLTGTAFLHSAIVQEKRGMLKAWNVVLVTLTFVLTLLGTFLTRSGVLWSIHAFANGQLGAYFLVFLGIVVVLSTMLIIWRAPVLKADRKFEAVVSKETGFMLNNVLFLGSAFAVLWGTVFPILSEALTGRKMMVSGPFYNAVNLPLAVCIMLLMGIGPVIAWRRAEVKNIMKSIVYPLAVAVGLGLAVAGVMKYAYQQASVLGTFAFIAAFYVILTVFSEFYRAVQSRMEMTKESGWTSFVRLVSRNRRRYGGYVVHFAIALMAIGIAGSGAYHVDQQQQMSPGETTHIGDYKITFDGMGVSQTGESRDMYANLIVERGGNTLGVLRPSATFYNNGQQPTTNVALYSRPLQDLYVVMLGTSQGDKAVFDMHINPLVQWIWYGGYLFILGTLISLWPASFRKQASSFVRVNPSEEAIYQQLAELEYDYKMGKISTMDYERGKSELAEEIRQVEQATHALQERLLQELDDEVQKARNAQTKAEGEQI
jgi:cytochrome c-type biogenesis protein CcmF